MRLRHLPLRLGAGAYILNSGLGKRHMDDEAAEGAHAMAAHAYPFLAGMDPKTFAKALSTAEITLGAALLVPFAPSVLVATGFAAFSAGLVGLYARTPSLHKDGLDLRPTPAGVGVAKDVIMLGAALTYWLDVVGSKGGKGGRR